MQTRIESLVESLTNIVVGFWFAVLAQTLIFPLYGVNIPVTTNVKITVWFTAISIFRSYCLRRIFNLPGFRDRYKRLIRYATRNKD